MSFDRAAGRIVHRATGRAVRFPRGELNGRRDLRPPVESHRPTYRRNRSVRVAGGLVLIELVCQRITETGKAQCRARPLTCSGRESISLSMLP